MAKEARVYGEWRGCCLRCTAVPDPMVLCRPESTADSAAADSTTTASRAARLNTAVTGLCAWLCMAVRIVQHTRKIADPAGAPTSVLRRHRPANELTATAVPCCSCRSFSHLQSIHSGSSSMAGGCCTLQWLPAPAQVRQYRKQRHQSLVEWQRNRKERQF